jgi:ERF superfamily
VRKTLGQHEIATLQTTAIDQTAGMVNLTTTLAHASGEWIASDWPVCPIAETANPQRMGAALTYARRYALFTLVGIAGEDDIDAPDLCAGPDTPSSTTPERALHPADHNSPGQSQRPINGRGRGGTKSETRVILDPAQSTKLRDKLLIEVENIASADVAATWAGEALVAKNSLTASDAKVVEDAFERKLSQMALSDSAAPSNDGSSAPQIPEPQVIATAEATDPGQANGIDKSLLALAAPRRYRSREHLRYVMQQPCLVCGRKPSDPHHLRYMQPRALARKASDEFAVPLCRAHQGAAHRASDERAWWKAAGIDPIKIARRLWKETRVNEGRVPRDAMPVWH